MSAPIVKTIHLTQFQFDWLKDLIERDNGDSTAHAHPNVLAIYEQLTKPEPRR